MSSSSRVGGGGCRGLAGGRGACAAGRTRARADDEAAAAEALECLVVCCNSSKPPPSDHPVASDDSSSNKPGKDLLDSVAARLALDLTNFFVKAQDYTLYREDLVFENRISGRTTIGLPHYRQQMNLLKILGHIKYVFIKFGVLKLTTHPDDGEIHVRWRIIGLGMLRLALNYIPKQLWRLENQTQAASTWYDGFSTFSVDASGQIFRHVADNKMATKEAAAAAAAKNIDRIKQKLGNLKPDASPAL